MSITLRQQPTTPNMANADLLWEVSSNQIAQPQYQFVVDVFESGSATLIQRVKQQPNPSGYGVFNLRQILSYQLESDGVWKTLGFSTSSFCNKDFIVKFGEEYGTSVSSSVVLYDGSGSPGAPNKTGSSYYTFTDGLVEPNSGAWNFPSQSFYYPTNVPTAGVFNFDKTNALTDSPLTKSVQDGEYETISIYNGNFSSSSDTAQDVYYYQVNVYNSAGSNIQNFGYYNIKSEGGGPRTTSVQEWYEIYNSQSAETRLLHLGVGPQNFADDGNTLNTNWAYYKISVLSQESAGIEDSQAIYDSRVYTKQNPQCIDDGVRFAWKNEYGVWDYFTATLATAQTSTMERLDYEQTFVPYNTSTTAVNYDITKRGTNPFNTKITQDKTANSDWLTQEYADWLMELFYSTNVYVQDGSNFVPVVITNASVVEKTNPRSQKLYNYAITYRLANQPRSRF